MRNPEWDMKIVEKMEQDAAAVRHGVTNVSETAIHEFLELAAALRYWIEEAARLKKEDAEKADWINTVSWENRELESKLWDMDRKARRLKYGLLQITRRYKPSDPESMAAMIVREAKAYLEEVELE